MTPYQALIPDSREVFGKGLGVWDCMVQGNVRVCLGLRVVGSRT